MTMRELLGDDSESQAVDKTRSSHAQIDRFLLDTADTGTVNVAQSPALGEGKAKPVLNKNRISNRDVAGGDDSLALPPNADEVRPRKITPASRQVSVTASPKAQRPSRRDAYLGNLA